MNVIFNAIPLLSPLTGIGQYTYQLAKGLQTTPNLNFNFFYATGWSNELRNKPVEHIVKIKSIFKRIIPHAYFTSRYLQQSNFNKGLKSKALTLYHEPNFLPFKFKGPTIVTAHDLSWIRFPETHPSERVNMMNRYFEPGIRRADLILTDSVFVKREIMDVFGLPSEQIKAIPLGVEDLFHPRTVEETEATLTRYQLTHGQYIVSIGTLEPRKNIHVTLEAYTKLPAMIRKRFPLILIGMKGWHTSNLEKQIAPLVRSGEIRQLGYVPREDLAVILSGALTMIFPSIYEGFGLPPLEAMASGVPVIASNVSSLPEVVGDTGFLVDPFDSNGIKNTIEQLIDEPNLRQNLSEKARARSLSFSWENCINETIDAYKHVFEKYA